MSRRFMVTATVVGLLLVSGVDGVRGRTSSLETLARVFQTEADSSVRELLRRGETVGLAFVATGENAAAIGRIAERLVIRLATLSPSKPGGAPVVLPRLSGIDGAMTDRQGQVRAARRLGWRRMLRIEAFVVEGRLVLMGELLSLDGSIWEQLVRPVGGVTAHFYATHRIDAEIRALLGLAALQLPSEWTLVKLEGAKLRDGPVLDLAAADLDGDGQEELLVLTPAALHSYRLASGQLVTAFPSFSLAELPSARVRSRVPFGTLTVASVLGDERPEVALSTSEQGAGVMLCSSAAELRPCAADAVTVSLTCGDSVDDDAVDGRMLLCGFPAGSVNGASLFLNAQLPGRPFVTGPPRRWDVEDGELVRSASDVAHTAMLWRRGRVLLPKEGASLDYDVRVSEDGVFRMGGAVLEGVGHAFAVGDLNDDGQPELIAASDSAPGAPDRVRVATLDGSGTLKPVWSRRSAPIQAVATGDLDHDGTPDFVVATRGKSDSFSEFAIAIAIAVVGETR